MSRDKKFRHNVDRCARRLVEHGEVQFIRFRPEGAAQGGGDPRWDLYDAGVDLAQRSWLTETGQVIYKAEKDACRPFPDPRSEQLLPGVKRNFQILSPLEFLAEFTQHIPPKG